MKLARGSEAALEAALGKLMVDVVGDTVDDAVGDADGARVDAVGTVVKDEAVAGRITHMDRHPQQLLQQEQGQQNRRILFSKGCRFVCRERAQQLWRPQSAVVHCEVHPVLHDTHSLVEHQVVIDGFQYKLSLYLQWNLAATHTFSWNMALRCRFMDNAIFSIV